jgi:hypothetical protein
MTEARNLMWDEVSDLLDVDTPSTDDVIDVVLKHVSAYFTKYNKVYDVLAIERNFGR